MLKSVRLFFLFIIQTSFVFGHGNLHEQIKSISAQITVTPNNPLLWLARADLHQSHRSPHAARLDLVQATKLKPPHPPAFLKLTQFERKRGELHLARKALNSYFTILSKIDEKPSPQAYREKALLSKPHEALEAWQLYLKSEASPTMLDFTIAAQTAYSTKNLTASRDLLKSGLDRHPKSIQLHQLHAQVSLAEEDPKSAQSSFNTLELLYPNLLLKLNYEEALIWEEHQHPTHSQQALLAALKAYQKLPTRLKKNPDIQTLIAKVQADLQK